ncbi:MAG: efflux RND transporter permease subunit [Leptospira sp.]|nr:efflux RND transporter permease subunit [Leptospira sp.]
MRVLNSIVRFSLDNSILIIFLSICLTGFGMFSIQNLKMDAIPDITNTQVQIVTSAPSLSTLEIEQYITYPIERGLSGVSDVEEIRSISRYGISLITLVFQEDVPIWKARQMVSEKMIEVQTVIPAHYGIPVIAPPTTALGEVIQFTLKSANHTQKELTDTIVWYISPILKALPGIVDVNLFGGEIRQIQIFLDRDRMASLNLSNQEIMDAIRKNNISTGAGYIERNREHFIIGFDSLIKNISDIGLISIGSSRNGVPIFLNSIADIREGHELRKGAATENGRSEVVGGIALMQMGDNALNVSQLVASKINELKSTLPEGMEIDIFYNRSDMVLGTIRTILFNLGEGAFLVILVLFIMMGSLRSGLIIAIIIPLCMLFAIMIMVVRDAPANLMSMGAIDFGLLVDGAVIVVENASRRLSMERNRLKRVLSFAERKEVIYKATLEVRRATIFGELIIGVVYIPILVMSGIEGMLFRPMALTVLYALAGAFIFTLSLVPVLVLYFLKEPKEFPIQKKIPSVEQENQNEENQHEETKIFQKIKTSYTLLLRKAFLHKRKVLYSSLFVFALSLSLFPFIGKEFIPVLDEGSSLLEISRLPSTSLEESVSSSLRIERMLMSKDFPEVQGIVSKTGSPNLALEPMGIEKTDVFIQLKPRNEWDRSKEELLDAISDEMEEKFPEMAFGLSQPIEMRSNEMIAGIRSDIGIKIFGRDLKELKRIAEQTSKIVKNIKGVRDIRIEQLGGLTYIKIIPNRERMARFGVSAEDISQLSLMVASGVQIDKLIDGARTYNIALRMKDAPTDNVRSWKNILVSNNKGVYIPLGEVADIINEEGPAQISHEWQERRVLVEFNVRGRDTIAVVEEVKDRLDREKILPAGYRYEFDGTYQNFISAMNSLYIIVPITLILVYTLLWFAVENILVSWLLFINITFAVTGGIFSLFIRGIPFSISAGVGFIALCGVAVLNSLVLVTFSMKREEKGESPEEAIFQSAVIRLRPVIMTGLVAILGFVPMAIATSPGSEVQRPLATVVIGGLIMDMVLTLFVFPIIYATFRTKPFSKGI